MSPELLYQWMVSVETAFPNLLKWQAVGLAFFSYGVVMARHCQLNRVAEEMGAWGRADSVKRRLQRWLSNGRIDVSRCCYWWVKWVWERSELPRAVLLVDETKLGDWIGVLMVSLAFEGRAIPLMWRAYIANSQADYPSGGQVQTIAILLAKVLEALPEDARPIVEADRGIGNSSKMMRAVSRLGLTLVFRVKQSSVIRTRRGVKHHLSDLVKSGESWSGSGWLFNAAEDRLWMHVHILWEVGQAQPWCLATNERALRASGYAIRMWQEESFRDLKSGGWQWQATHIHDPHRAERLILVLALAYAWCLTQGVLARSSEPALRRQVITGTQSGFSLFRDGLRFIKRMLHINPSRIYAGLVLVPYQLRP